MPCSVASDVLDLFLALASISSPPGRERAVADEVCGYLRELGLEPVEDDAGARIGSEIGNIVCAVPATAGGQGDDGADGAPGVPIFLCAHLDTVEPTGPIEPVVTGGLVTNVHDTILGADNKAAVAAMLAAVGRVVQEGRPHSGVELVLTPMEEVGLRGAKELDTDRLLARLGYCYDHAAPIGNVVLAAPAQHTIRMFFRGRAAHSGIEPERGRSAIVAATRAIAEMELGRIDEETTANVGLISGGVAKNIVPPRCEVWAEARSRDAKKAREVTRSIVDGAVYAANLVECEVDTQITPEYDAYRFTRRDPPVRLAARALEAAGYEATYIESGGGADANVFNARGIPCVNLCNGMAAIHTADEQIAVADLHGMVDVTLALIDAAHAGVEP
jgi:tripeptide aminopeptidase